MHMNQAIDVNQWKKGQNAVKSMPIIKVQQSLDTIQEITLMRKIVITGGTLFSPSFSLLR